MGLYDMQCLCRGVSNVNRPLSIIMDMRQYLVLEQSSAPTELNAMMTNIENNGAPWPFNQQDRLNWSKE